MYATTNFRTKKALKDAVTRGDDIGVYSPSPFPAPTSGDTSVEGPWSPQPHTWYARVTLVNGRIVKVK
jgi:hypothetical protein